MSTPSVIGQIVTRKDVTDAVVSLLTDTPGETPNWLELYLREIESQKGILHRLPRPSKPESVHGGLDFESWDESLIPEIIVVAQPAAGGAERRASGDYDQWYEIEVAVMIVERDQQRAIDIADYYGAAIMAAIVQNNEIGALDAVMTELVSAPKTEYDQVETRTWARSVGTFRTLVQAVVNDRNRPDLPTPIPPLAPNEATSVDITLDTYPVDEPIPGD